MIKEARKTTETIIASFHEKKIETRNNVGNT